MKNNKKTYSMKQTRPIILFMLLVFMISFTSTLYLNAKAEEPLKLPTSEEKIGDLVLEPLLDGLTDTICSFLELANDWFSKAMYSAFSPQLFYLVGLEEGKSLDMMFMKEEVSEDFETEDLLEYQRWKETHNSLKNSEAMHSIWQFSAITGYITVVLIAMSSILLCIAGQTESIKDTPLSILGKFLVSIAGIVLSPYLMSIFIDLFYEIWKAAVVPTVDNISILEMAWLGNRELLEFSTFAAGEGLILTIAGISLSIPSGGTSLLLTIPILIIIIILVYLAIKLIKEFFKLFLEIIERYFVLFFLLAMFPLAIATFTAHSSRRIFSAYIRMIYTQGLLLIINSVFMAIFIKIGANGGWSAGLINYIAAFAFLRFCQRIDAYFAQLGLNVVQTGSGLISAIGGFGGGMLAAMKAVRGVDNFRKNTGKQIAETGVHTNKFDTFAVGNALSSSLGQIVGGKLASGNVEASFSNQVNKANPVPKGSSVTEGFDANNSIAETIKGTGIDEVSANKAAASLSGYDLQDGSVTRFDDNSLSFQDKDGNYIASWNNGEMSYADGAGASTGFMDELANRDMKFMNANGGTPLTQDEHENLFGQYEPPTDGLDAPSYNQEYTANQQALLRRLQPNEIRNAEYNASQDAVGSTRRYYTGITQTGNDFTKASSFAANDYELHTVDVTKNPELAREMLKKGGKVSTDQNNKKYVYTLRKLSKHKSSKQVKIETR